ncbi:hypothetical protein GJ496_009292 [Pomphorhynchus laevis]|nr:hypothetical protein GJ496_009292 [Pomphorhynchus laevis]
MQLHKACRNSKYCGIVQRTFVPDNLVLWSIPWPYYSPVEFTDERILSKVNKPYWADDESVTHIKFNCIDNGLNRRSYDGIYSMDTVTGRPINPKGRTGISGRGLLGHWGPNHAADSLVYHMLPNSRIKFIAITRKDTKSYALPGGMIDKGETPKHAAVRELMEEAFASSKLTVAEMGRYIDFENYFVPFEGYVDDHRNTDNAWMETVVHCFKANDNIDSLSLCGGDDAESARWLDLSDSHILFDGHQIFLELLRKHINT